MAGSHPGKGQLQRQVMPGSKAEGVSPQRGPSQATGARCLMQPPGREQPAPLGALSWNGGDRTPSVLTSRPSGSSVGVTVKQESLGPAASGRS